MAKTDGKLFQGYISPKYTQIPDILFDEQLADLSGAELKVLLYIMRRTFGFKKDADDISINQIATGITTREGTVLDRGTGLSKSTVQVALKGLIENGIVLATKRVSIERGNEATTYELNVGDRPYTENRHRAIPKIDIGLYRKSAQQYTEEQETEIQDSNIRNETNGKLTGKKRITAAERALSANTPQVSSTSAQTGESISSADVVRPAGRHRGNTDQQARRATQPTAIGETLNKGRGVHPVVSEDRQVLTDYLSDFAREMNDEAPLRVSVSRAMNLLARSNLPRQRFIDLMFEARSRTKESSSSIRKTITKDGSAFSVKAKMPFFFATLEQLCGLSPEASSQTNHSVESS